MSLYDEVLNCPDTHCRKEALDKLCKEKIAEGMEKAASSLNNNYYWAAARLVRQAAEDLEDS